MIVREPDDIYGQALDSLLHGNVYVRKDTAYIPITHELLVDNDPSHVCGPDCPPEPGPPPPLPWDAKFRYALRRARWRLARLGGLRLVHKDRIDQDRDD